MSTNITSLVNGVAADKISIADRGLHYGDGCFETIAVQQGRALLWDQHIQRLVSGCQRLGINTSVMADELSVDAEKIITSAMNGVLKIIVTRGAGERGYRSDNTQRPTRIVTFGPLPQYAKDYRHEGIALRLCDTRLSEHKTLAGIKHLNRLEQVLARSEWQDQYQEGLMLNQAGQVIEGTMSNVFVQIGDEVITPLLNHCGVAGVMRSVIFDKLSDKNINCQQRQLELQTLYDADAIFICNSIIGLWPVISLDNKSFPITDLQRHLQNAISNVCI